MGTGSGRLGLADAADDLATPGGLEMAVFQMPYGGRRSGSVIGRLFKVLLVAVLIAGIGLGAMCYFDEGVRGKTIAYWEQFVAWAKSLTTGPSILRSILTVEPHSLEWAVALAWGSGRRPRRGIFPANSMIRLL